MSTCGYSLAYILFNTSFMRFLDWDLLLTPMYLLSF